MKEDMERTEQIGLSAKTSGENRGSGDKVALLRARAEDVIARENELAKERRAIVAKRVALEAELAGFAIGQTVEANLRGKWVLGTITGFSVWAYNDDTFAGVWYPEGVQHDRRQSGGFWLTSLRPTGRTLTLHPTAKTLLAVSPPSLLDVASAPSTAENIDAAFNRIFDNPRRTAETSTETNSEGDER